MRKLSIFLSIIVILTSFSLFGCVDKVDTTSYDIEVELENNTLIGKETVSFYNGSENSLSFLKFNLYGNAFREGAKYSPISAQYFSRAYPNGISYGDMQINAVTSNGKPLEFSVGGKDLNVLTVKLKDQIFPSERVDVTIEFTLNLANVVSRTGYNDNTVNLANFYPILCVYEPSGFYECEYYSHGDPFYSECANYSVKITADSDYVIASAGEIIGSEQKGQKTQSHFKLDNARSFAMVLSKRFQTVTDNSTGVEVSYYYYKDQDPNSSLEYAIKSMELFCEKFGEYPYSTYAVVQTEFIQGGMEFPSLVMISDNLEKDAYGEVIVHETAHQWWQSVVGNNEVEHAFLDEGLAEYSVVVFYESYPEYGFKREQLIDSSEKTYKVFCSVFDKVIGKVNTVMLRGLKDFTSEYEYVNMAYIKPCIMFDYLRKSIGDKAFFAGLNNYYGAYKFKIATPDDLIAVYENSGKDTEGFFNSFFLGKVII